MQRTTASTQNALSAALWATADAARGNVADPLATTLPQLGVLLLLRWIDLLDAEREAIALFNDEDYERVLSAGLAWESWSSLRGRALEEHIQQSLLPGLAAIRADAFPIDLSHSAIGEALRPAAPLDLLIAAVAELPFETAADQRQAGEAFGQLVRTAIERSRHGGAFATPPAVARLIAQLAAPMPGERVFDPCFGSGELLVQCVSQLHGRSDFQTAGQWERVQAESIFGVEISPSIHLVGLVRVLLAGVDRPGLALGDALHRPLESAYAQRFDVVVAVPPWGQDRHDHDRPEHFLFKTNTLEASFLQLAMLSLRPGGRAVLAVPEGILFRGGAEKAMRRWLLEEHRVRAIIQLPSGSFLPYTGVKVSLLVVEKGGTTKSVRFINLNELGDSLGQNVDAIGGWVDGSMEGGPLTTASRQELAERDWTLLAPSVSEAEYQTVVLELGELEEARVARLAELASLANGLGYTRAKTTENRDDPDAGPGLVRVRDVDERRVQPPTLFARHELAERAKEGQVLRSGDLVVTTSGTIGRVGTVTNGSVGCIASNGVVVVRPKPGVSGRFLGGLLRSPLVQELMVDQARGVAVQHLSVSVLRGLALPVPPLAIQERIAEAIEHRGGDALAMLRLVLTEDTHPIVTFLETDPSVHAVRHLRNSLAHARTADADGDPLALLRRLGKGLLRVLEEGDDASEIRFSSEVRRWVESLTTIARGLAGIATDAPAPSTVPIQLSTQSAVASALRTASATIPDDLRAHSRSLERGLDSAWFLLTHAARTLVRDIAVEVYQVDPDRDQGPQAESALGRWVTIEVRNSGSAPLLQFRATLSASSSLTLCEISEDFLLGDATKRYNVTIPAEQDALDAVLSWTGSTSALDLMTGERNIELTFADSSDDEDVTAEAMGPSPYIVGNPVDRPEMFFGREDIIEKMRVHLAQEGVANVILLEGNRRTGKTSILKSLQRPDTLPTHVAVYCSFQASAGHETELGVPTDEVFKTIGRALVRDCTLAGFPLPLPGVPEDLVGWPDKKRKGFIHMKLPQLVNSWFRGRAAFSALESLVPVAIDAVEPKRLLLMLDEFDKLQEGIDSGVTSPQVPENIRYLFQNNTGMAGVLTGSRRIRRLREEYWNALFGFGFAISVTALPHDAAELLVQKPVQGRLAFQPAAIEQITSLCARHPFLIQLLCARVFDRAVADGVRHVSRRQVDAAVEDLIRDNEHFRTLWGYAGSERARYILFLCHDLHDGPDPVTFDLLQNRLETVRVGYDRGDGFGDGSGSGSGDGSGYGYGNADGNGWGDGTGPRDHGVLVSADGLRDDIDHLKELELISQVPDGRYHVYQLTVPLMGLWIEKNIDSRELLKLAIQEGRTEQ